MEGSGKMLVTAVGIHSQTGIIMQLLCAADGHIDQQVPADNPKKNGEAAHSMSLLIM